MMLSNPLLCHPLLLLTSIFPSIRVFSNESALHIRCPKHWSFSFSISLSSEYSGLISFRNDWFDLLAVQRTFKSLLQHHSSKASILLCSAFFMVQLTSLHDYWKNYGFDYTDLYWQSYVSVSVNFVAAVTVHSDFGAQENKICHCFYFFPFCLPWSDGIMILVFWMLNFKPAFSLSSLTLIRRLFSSFSLSAVRVLPSAYLRLLIFLLAILISACHSPTLACRMMYSA